MQLDNLAGMSLLAGKALSSARMSDAVQSRSSLMGSQQLQDGEGEGKRHAPCLGFSALGYNLRYKHFLLAVLFMFCFNGNIPLPPSFFLSVVVSAFCYALSNVTSVCKPNYICFQWNRL